MDLVNCKQVAEMLGVSARRVRARAQALNARGVVVGWQVPGTRQWLFQQAEVAILRPGAVGRPKGGRMDILDVVERWCGRDTQPADVGTEGDEAGLARALAEMWPDEGDADVAEAARVIWAWANR